MRKIKKKIAKEIRNKDTKDRVLRALVLSAGDAYTRDGQCRGGCTAFIIGQEHLKSLQESIRPAWPGIIAPL